MQLTNNKTVLLTGATGYLGGYLSEMLLKKGYKLIALALNRGEKYAYTDNEKTKIYYLNETPVEKIFEDNEINIIIHTSTLYGRNNEQLSQMVNVNVEFPLKILSLAIKKGVELFINTDTILARNTNAYSLTKRQFVDWLSMYAAKIKVANLRLDHFYGAKDKPIKFIAWLIEQFKNEKEQIDLTDGLQTRDFVYIEDVVNAYSVILSNTEKLSTEEINTFEVGSGKTVTVKEMILTLKELMNNTTTQLNFGAIPHRKNEILEYNVDISKLKELGYNPIYDIKKGLSKVVEIEEL